MQAVSRRTIPVLAALVALLVPAVALAQRPVPVTVNSVPPGATIRVDDDNSTPLGTTNGRVRIRPGFHTVILSLDGYAPARIPVTVVRRTPPVTAPLVQYGRLVLDGNFHNAQISVDGRVAAPSGNPGMSSNNMEPGDHSVSIHQEGMEDFTQQVHITSGQTSTVSATLHPPAPTTGGITAIITTTNNAAPADLIVRVDGRQIGGDPPSVNGLPPGNHVVTVSATGFRTPQAQNVTVVAGPNANIGFTLEPTPVAAPTTGTIRVVTSTPGARIAIDGQPVEGNERTGLDAGPHIVQVTAPGRQPYQNNAVAVTAGQTVVLPVPDLTVAAQEGRIRVVSPTPGAHILIDGQDVGTSPYNNEHAPVGAHTVLVHADGFDDRTETCAVSTTDACDLTLPLARTMGRALLHVELGHPIRAPAVLLIDGTEVGEIGAGRDVPGVTATTHEIRVRAVGYADYVESVTFAENEQHRTMVLMHRAAGAGPSAAARRAALSTWSGSPLSQRDVAMDVIGSYGAYPIEARFAAGILPYGIFGWDAGVGVRTMGWLWELELRTRAGVRLANGLFSMAAEARAFAGTAFSGQNNGGAGMRAMFSFHTTAGGDSDEDDNDPNERSNRPGAFAFTLHIGFDYTSDQMTNVRTGSSTNHYDRIDTGTISTSSTMTRMADIRDLCSANTATRRCPEGQLPGGMEYGFTGGGQDLLRGLFGATIEVSLSRHINVFAQFERMFDTSYTQRRVYYAITWFGNDPLTYIRAGLTYKF
jgi:hypothetical protein